MAATDKTYRNQRTLNIVFAWSSVAFLLVCIWMMADDYNKPHKQVQREFRDVESNLSLALALEQTPEKSKVDEARQKLVKAREELAAMKAGLEKRRRELLAIRDKADNRYQLTKADFDALMSIRDIAAEHIGQAESIAVRAVAEAHVRQLDEKRKRLKEQLDANQLAL